MVGYVFGLFMLFAFSFMLFVFAIVGGIFFCSFIITYFLPKPPFILLDNPILLSITLHIGLEHYYLARYGNLLRSEPFSVALTTYETPFQCQCLVTNTKLHNCPTATIGTYRSLNSRYSRATATIINFYPRHKPPPPRPAPEPFARED